MENPTKKLPDSELATQHNALVHSRQTFTLLQQRILALAVAQIKRTDEGDSSYQVYIQDLVELGTGSEIYSRLDKEVKNMVSKVVSIKGRDEDRGLWFEHYSLLKRASYTQKSGVLELEFSAQVREWLFQLKGQFSSIVAIEKASCSSVYGVRLYEMLASHWRFGEWEVSVENLRFSLGLEDKYKNFSHFRQRVLQTAQDDLRENTQMRFTWKELKRARGRGRGKKVTHIHFDFSWKPNQMDLGLETPDWSQGFDIYNLRSRIRESTGLHPREVHEIMEWIGRKEQDRQEAFKDNFHSKFEVPLQTDSPVEGGRRIENPRRYFLSRYKDWV